MRLFFPSAHTLPAPPPSATSPARTKPLESLLFLASTSRHRTPHRPCRHRTSRHRREATPSTPATIGNVAGENQTPWVASLPCFFFPRARRWLWPPPWTPLAASMTTAVNVAAAGARLSPSARKKGARPLWGSSPPCQPPRLGLPPSRGHTPPSGPPNRRRRGWWNWFWVPGYHVKANGVY